MATVHVYRLRPRSAFHFGERGVGVEETGDIFRSDSLFSALCSVVREGWGTAPLADLLEAFRARPDPPFRLSSCFPFGGDVLFFPRPMASLGAEPTPDAAKRLKRTRFISQDLFLSWLKGGNLSDQAQGANFLPESRAWLSTAERARLARLLPESEPAEAARRSLWWKDEVPRVAVDRQTNASAVYRCARLAFRPDCGLYFLVEWRDEAFRPLVERALHVLGDAGLGGRRSSGYGQFEPLPPQPLDLPAPARPNALLTLALYWPAPEELAAGVLGEPARFDLVTRSGWISSPEGRALRRRDVRMVAEGSLLAAVAASPGRLADVTPTGFQAHPVYRYGLAFPLPVRIPEVGHA